jgi:6-phosphogluconolactonase
MKITSKLVLLFTILFMSCSTSKNNTFLIGTYTENKGHGINIIDFNATTKALSMQKVVSGIENPSFVITNKAKTIVVAVEEIASEKGGKVTSFAYDSNSTSFKKINSQFTLGDHPCTAAFSSDEKYVLVGNYSGGNLSVFPIDAKGNLSEANQTITFEGKSINQQRQEKPHVHCIAFHPTENKIAVADLGRDSIDLIPFDEKASLFLQEDKVISTKVPSGSGPRHLVFNSKGTRLYATFELTNEVAIFDYSNDKLQLLQTIPLTKYPTKSGSAAEVRLSADEQFLYASVRGNDNQLVVIQLNEGKNAEVVQSIATGKSPRNFIISKDQKSVLVANQFSNSIIVFDRNKKTGVLTPTLSELTINQPVYLYPF